MKLTSTTPKADLAKLRTALEAVNGVNKVVFHLETHEFDVEAKPTQNPKREAITAAANTAGFPISA